ncbi:hypothetical protein AB0E55_23035 [Amycolatopsis keratiniphila]|uniref:NucA/NucB deoxyribonuclease domain-containing protein n=1 Tax=Amycolatopsis keratiniphila TaxID=129921 RepID=UPI0033C03999
MSIFLSALLGFTLTQTASATAERPRFYILEEDGKTAISPGDGQDQNEVGRPKDTLAQRAKRDKEAASKFYNKDGSGLVSPGDSARMQAVTPGECRSIETGEPEFKHKDRFTSCRNMKFGIGYPNEKALEFHVTVAYTAANDGSQSVRAEFYIHNPRVVGDPPAGDRDTQVGIQALCSAISFTNCSGPGPVIKTMGQWMAQEHLFTQVITTSGTTTARDGKALYEIGHVFYDPISNSYPVQDRTDLFRCDTASYVQASPGCVFTARTFALNYNMARDRYPEVVDHIRDAQYNPGVTKPGNFTLIPGNPKDGTPLTRLYPDYDRTTYNRNNYKAVQTCKQFWGDGYPEGGKFECDEYPFRSTYQGAAYSDNGGTVGYSARPLLSEQNGEAGRDLGRFYREYRILDGDGFFVNSL